MNMTVERRAALVLAGVLLALALAALGWQAGIGHRTARYRVLTREPVSGLIAGAPVEFHGVEVGQVRAVRLRDAQTVAIELELDRSAPVSAATVATVTGRGVAARGFTGYVFISLEDRGGSAGPLVAQAGDLPTIASAPAQSASLDTTMETLARSVQSVNGLLQATLDPDTIGALRQSVASLSQLARTLAANNARLDAILARTEAASRELPPLVHASAQVAATLRTQVLPRTLDTLATVDSASRSASDRLAEMARRTQQAGDRVETLLASSDEVARSLRDDVLPEADRSLRRLERLTATLDEVAHGVGADPAALVRGPGAPRLGPGEAR